MSRWTMSKDGAVAMRLTLAAIGGKMPDIE
jgi:hypothetical protein